jgi:hypothetical protein
MIGLHNWLENLVESFTFYGGGKGKGGGGSQAQTQTQDIAPWLKEYVTYGLGEAKNLYQGSSPTYFPGQTYVDPSMQTTSAIDLATKRAMAGSPLTSGAIAQQTGTIGGSYLGANPYLAAALKPGQEAATTAYEQAISGARSNLAGAGRYGSGAQVQLESLAGKNLANALANQAGQAAYQNYATERGLQQQSALAAPQLAQSEYADINQLLQAGQLGEQYKQAALESDIERYNFEQQKPYEKLSAYLGSVYGAPVPMTTTGSSTSTVKKGKIVCSMMNEFYGTAPFRNRVWLLQSQRMPNAKVIEKGYHTIFLPLVEFAKKDGFLNKVVRKTLEHIARHRTADVYREMRNGKRDILGRIYRNILEPICYATGKMKGAK